MTPRAATAEPPRLAYRSVARTHAGARAVNEDRWLAAPEAGLWVVADGMGGHAAGEVAAAMVVDALAELGRFGSAYAQLNAVSDRLQSVNAALVARAASSRAGVMGSTVVALLVHDDHYACLWAGDSRAYRMRRGQLERLTQDHSLVQAMVDAGALSPEESARHVRANVITRAVGAGEPLELDMLNDGIEAGDVFLLCSDGLTGVVSDAEIEAVMSRNRLDPAADALIGLTLERGAPDNVTLVLVEAA